MPRLAEQCLRSWERLLPDYELRIWTEENFDVEQTSYSLQAYSQKKYAFVSDFARFDLLYRYGGIYMDVDVEVVRNLDRFLAHEAFSGFEHGEGVNPGLIIGSVPQHQLISELRSQYEARRFVLNDDSLDLTTVVTVTTDLLKSKGLIAKDELQEVAGMSLYPTTYFCPMDRHTGRTALTPNTHTIHHYAGSWHSPVTRWKHATLRALGPDVTRHAVRAKAALQKLSRR